MKNNFTICFPEAVGTKFLINFINEKLLESIKVSNVPIVGEGPPSILEGVSVKERGFIV